ncbi:MAG: HEPN domain-containing protein [Vicinamibacterales bacterium]
MPRRGLRALDVLYDCGSWADVVKSQEVVELALKGLLRACGVEPPRVHDVADVLEAERERLPAAASFPPGSPPRPPHANCARTANSPSAAPRTSRLDLLPSPTPRSRAIPRGQWSR